MKPLLWKALVKNDEEIIIIKNCGKIKTYELEETVTIKEML